MRVLGIIAEYNPFHNGHLYHLEESLRMISPDYTICVMSGNFTQRGEPAMADKWTRAEAAVRSGIDLVLELPFAFACNNAEYFAMGAVDILDRLGCVTHLSFGSESGDLAALSIAAGYLAHEDEELKDTIREFADRGISFPKARYEAVKKLRGETCSDVLKSANNILAVEYLKQLYRRESKIEPITVKRYGTGYHEKETFENIASATAIRHQLQETGSMDNILGFVPDATFQVLQDINTDVNNLFNKFYPLLLYRILTSNPAELGRTLSATEGLENKVIKAAAASDNMETLIKGIRSKRYTATRISRLLVHILMRLEKDSFREITEEGINYARVLGFSQKGAELLKKIKKEGRNTIPILTNINREVPKDGDEWKLLKYDITASGIYHLAVSGETRTRSDYIMQPYRNFE